MIGKYKNPLGRSSFNDVAFVKTLEEQRDSKDTGSNSNQDGVVIIDHNNTQNSLTAQSFYQETERQFVDESKSKMN